MEKLNLAPPLHSIARQDGHGRRGSAEVDIRPSDVTAEYKPWRAEKKDALLASTSWEVELQAAQFSRQRAGEDIRSVLVRLGAVHMGRLSTPPRR